jgi:hypothetical membrane protein
MVYEKGLRDVGIAKTRNLLMSGVALAPTFLLAIFLTAQLRPDYSSLRHPVSSLAIGAGGWMQRATFIACGLLMVTCAAGLRVSSKADLCSRWLWRLVALSGAGMVGAGIFKTDAVYGYPSGAPLRLAQFTTTGHMHDLWSMMFFLGLPVAAAVDSRWNQRRGNRWTSRTSAITTILIVVLFVLTARGFAQVEPLETIAGLLQRATILIGMVWLGVTARRVSRLVKR